MTEANVVVALSHVMADMPGIGKGDRSEQGYSYRGIEQITKEARPLLAKHGVVFVPRVVNREVYQVQINNRPWSDTVLEVVYTVYGPGGIEDRIEVGPLVGIGRDNSDKGANKAMSQAFKYALLQTLCIGDTKDDGDSQGHEADAHSQVHRSPRPRRAQPPDRPEETPRGERDGMSERGQAPVMSAPAPDRVTRRELDDIAAKVAVLPDGAQQEFYEDLAKLDLPPLNRPSQWVPQHLVLAMNLLGEYTGSEESRVRQHAEAAGHHAPGEEPFL